MKAGAFVTANADLLLQVRSCKTESETIHLLRAARDHFAAGPNAIELILGPTIDAETFERLLAAGAAESAARRLVSSGQIGILISAGACSDWLVTLRFNDEAIDVSHRAATEAAAVVGALLKLTHWIFAGSPITEIADLRVVPGD